MSLRTRSNADVSDEMDSLVEFLGREPNNEAFLKELLSGAAPDARL